MTPPVQASAALSCSPCLTYSMAPSQGPAFRRPAEIGRTLVRYAVQGALGRAASPTRSAGQHIHRHVPQAVGVLGVERVGSDAVVVGRAVGDAHGLVAVLEIAAADSLQER